jgi:hypothetical protein
MPGSSDLTPAQAGALAQILMPQARYLSRLVWRMQRLGWPNDDPLYARALRARDAALALIDQVNQVKDRADMPAWIRARGD